MASDSLNQVGKYFKKTRRDSDFAIKRVAKRMPIRDRARDTVSSVYPFTMNVLIDNQETVSIDINFNKPPPDECAADCIATACEDFALLPGGHSITVGNPYVEGSIRSYTNGDVLEEVQFYEENPSGGQVYVQVQGTSATIVVCYSYIIC